MLVAVGVNANDQLFLLALAKVKGETMKISLVHGCIRATVAQGPDSCLIFDRHKGIIVV